MTKQEAIDLLDNLIGMIEDNHGSDYDSAIRMAIEALEPQWIPVSERLPEEKKEVLVSADGDLYIAILETINGELSWSEVIEYRYIMGVDAWMPLPEPWKGEEE